MKAPSSENEKAVMASNNVQLLNVPRFSVTDSECTRAVAAKIYNATYLECEAPASDVVEKPIPFTVSLNNQQNSKDTLWFYYYN